jgi:hypothetical protein
MTLIRKKSHAANQCIFEITSLRLSVSKPEVNPTLKNQEERLVYLGRTSDAIHY